MRPQFLKPTELELSDCSFCPSERSSDLADALFFREAHLDHTPLIRRECPHHPEQRCSMFHFLCVCLIRSELFIRGASLLARLPGPAVGDGVGGDAKKPRSEWDSTPFEFVEVCERLVKNLRREVFRFFAVAHSPGGERIHALEIVLVEVGETRRVLLRGLDQGSLLLCRLKHLQPVLRESPSE